MGQGQGGAVYRAIGTGGLLGKERGSGRVLGLGSGPGPKLGRSHTQKPLSVSVGHAQWHQERPLLLAVHMPRARKRLFRTRCRS